MEFPVIEQRTLPFEKLLKNYNLLRNGFDGSLPKFELDRHACNI